MLHSTCGKTWTLTTVSDRQPFGGVFPGQMNQISSSHTDRLYLWRKKMERILIHRMLSQLWSMVVVASCYGDVLLEKGTGTLRKTCGTVILIQEILTQHLETSAKMKKLGQGRVLLAEQSWNPKHTSKFARKGKDNKVKVRVWPSRSPDLEPTENLWTELKKRFWAEAHKPPRKVLGAACASYTNKSLIQVQAITKHCQQTLTTCA